MTPSRWRFLLFVLAWTVCCSALIVLTPDPTEAGDAGAASADLFIQVVLGCIWFVGIAVLAWGVALAQKAYKREG
jgi:hypothetical protein